MRLLQQYALAIRLYPKEALTRFQKKVYGWLVTAIVGTLLLLAAGCDGATKQDSLYPSFTNGTNTLNPGNNEAGGVGGGYGGGDGDGGDGDDPPKKLSCPPVGMFPFPESYAILLECDYFDEETENLFADLLQMMSSENQALFQKYAVENRNLQVLGLISTADGLLPYADVVGLTFIALSITAVNPGEQVYLVMTQDFTSAQPDSLIPLKHKIYIDTNTLFTSNNQIYALLLEGAQAGNHLLWEHLMNHMVILIAEGKLSPLPFVTSSDGETTVGATTNNDTLSNVGNVDIDISSVVDTITGISGLQANKVPNKNGKVDIVIAFVPQELNDVDISSAIVQLSQTIHSNPILQRLLNEGKIYLSAEPLPWSHELQAEILKTTLQTGNRISNWGIDENRMDPRIVVTLGKGENQFNAVLLNQDRILYITEHIRNSQHSTIYHKGTNRPIAPSESIVKYVEEANDMVSYIGTALGEANIPGIKSISLHGSQLGVALDEYSSDYDVFVQLKVTSAEAKSETIQNIIRVAFDATYNFELARNTDITRKSQLFIVGSDGILIEVKNLRN